MPLISGAAGGVTIPLDVTSSPAGTRLYIDEFGDLAVIGAPASISVSEGSPASPVVNMSTSQGLSSKQKAVTVVDAVGNVLGKIEDRGYLITAVHAAPADGDISAGEAWLWFDQTNGAGATKLMVKGKSADGTVKTAAIALA